MIQIAFDSYGHEEDIINLKRINRTRRKVFSPAQSHASRPTAESSDLSQLEFSA